jgi:probable rRNA maturation factor
VLLTDDDQLRELSRRYRDIDATTDVLSFAQHEGDGLCDTEALGDVVISVEQAARQASGGDLLDELVRLLVHGLCHLRGLDHARRAEAAAMRAEEERLLRAAGVVEQLRVERGSGPSGTRRSQGPRPSSATARPPRAARRSSGVGR